jgi:hypothetical protein
VLVNAVVVEVDGNSPESRRPGRVRPTSSRLAIRCSSLADDDEDDEGIGTGGGIPQRVWCKAELLLTTMIPSTICIARRTVLARPVLTKRSFVLSTRSDTSRVFRQTKSRLPQTIFGKLCQHLVFCVHG